VNAVQSQQSPGALLSQFIGGKPGLARIHFDALMRA